jgi:S1-C subfamily serine protease
MAYMDEVFQNFKQKQAQEAQAKETQAKESARSKMLEETRQPETPAFTRPEFNRQEPKRVEFNQETVTLDRTITAGKHNQLNYKDAIFRIYAPTKGGTSIGSGFFHTAGGEFVTDLHVVGDTVRCPILLSNGQQVVGVIDARDPQTDLAAGHVVDAKFKLPHLMLVNPTLLAGYSGATYTAGYPGGKEFKESAGEIRKVSDSGIVSQGLLGKGEDPTRQVIVTNNWGLPGMSGGVLFSKNWLPLGVIDKGGTNYEGDSSMTISTPIADCLRLIKQARDSRR